MSIDEFIDFLESNYIEYYKNLNVFTNDSESYVQLWGTDVPKIYDEWLIAAAHDAGYDTYYMTGFTQDGTIRNYLMFTPKITIPANSIYTMSA